MDSQWQQGIADYFEDLADRAGVYALPLTARMWTGSARGGTDLYRESRTETTGTTYTWSADVGQRASRFRTDERGWTARRTGVALISAPGAGLTVDALEAQIAPFRRGASGADYRPEVRLGEQAVAIEAVQINRISGCVVVDYVAEAPAAL